jgi:hypothetical protein
MALTTATTATGPTATATATAGTELGGKWREAAQKIHAVIYVEKQSSSLIISLAEHVQCPCCFT